MKNSEIKIAVELDNEKHPTAIHWEASDAEVEGKKSCKSILLSIWDYNEKTTLRIDLWTKEMSVNEMNQFFYESFVTMAGTYERATGNNETAQEIREFSEQFAKQVKLK